MSNFCIECRFYRGCDVDGKTPACHNFMQFGKTTLFDRLIASPEVLAPKLVYVIKQLFTISGTSRENPGGYEVKTKWFSTIVDGAFDNKAEAIAATVERLKEVANG